MSIVTKVARKFHRKFVRSWDLYRLGHNGNRISFSIQQSVRAALKGSLTQEEVNSVDRIERLRAEMNLSTEQVTRTDFGAREQDSNLKPDEMRAGVEVIDTLGYISQVASKPPFWCLLLFKLIRTIQPDSCVEMGTAVGLSAAYQATALTLNGHGCLVSLEGAASLADIAMNNFQHLGLDSVEIVVGNFQDTLVDVLTARQPVDFVFVDGHHDEHATLAYFEQILPFLAETALLVFDDITWSEGMARAWNSIASDSRVRIAVDFGQVGLCSIDNSMKTSRYYSIPLH